MTERKTKQANCHMVADNWSKKVEKTSVCFCLEKNLKASKTA